MSHGLQAQGSFTWAKSLDDNSASVAGDQFSNSIAALWNWFNPRLSKGLSDFNVARTLVINVTWDVPGSEIGIWPCKMDYQRLGIGRHIHCKFWNSFHADTR